MEYPSKPNSMLELAFQKKQNQAEIMDSAGIVYVVDFDTMIERVKSDLDDWVPVTRSITVPG
jgi:hypothetical protein